jgi:hypothetical protein
MQIIFVVRIIACPKIYIIQKFESEAVVWKNCRSMEKIDNMNKGKNGPCISVCVRYKQYFQFPFISDANFVAYPYAHSLE